MLATSMLFAGVMLALAQQSTANVVADYPEKRVSWTLEYPAVIGARVEDYYSCLKAGSYAIGSGRGFESQYREDIARCADKASKLEEDAATRLASSTSGAKVTRSDVSRIFETVRQVHLARGRSLDQTIRTNLRSSETYRAENGQASAYAAEDRACVERLRSLIKRRDTFVASRSDEMAARYAKETYTDEDRAALDAWTRDVSRFAGSIAFERSRCPAADYLELTADTDARDGAKVADPDRTSTN